ncbi:MAG: trypsin-like peptidase domain-containing protein [Candidatus Hermodarchaeota archaeon]
MAKENVRRAPEERLAFTVGYPAFDDRSDIEVQMRIFKGIFNVKRFAPGKIRSIFTYEEKYQFIDHDCTTLGGNSGSCVVDMETATVVGLHFGGLYLEYNLAIPIWEIEEAINKAKNQVS